MSIRTHCHVIGKRWGTYYGETIEQSAKNYYWEHCEPRDGEQLQVEWKRDDGSHGTVTATLRHEIEITGMRGEDSPTPEHQPEIDPGEGWRLLEPEELLQEGDQYWSNVNGRWMRSDNAGCSHKSQGAGLTYRRGINRDPKCDCDPQPTGARVEISGLAQWRRRCPSERELTDIQYADASHIGKDGKARVLRLTGWTIRKFWNERPGIYAWMPLPAPAEPPYEPPSGWVDISEREPCAQDADAANEILVDVGDGCLSTCDWDDVSGLEGIRWCTTKWAKERE